MANAGISMNILIAFDSNNFVRHLVEGENQKLVNLVLSHYTDSITKFSKLRRNANWTAYIEAYKSEQLLELIMEGGLGIPCVDEDGAISNSQQRFWELLDICINTFSVDVLSQLAELRRVGKKIVTVVVVSYDKFTLKLMVTTK